MARFKAQSVDAEKNNHVSHGEPIAIVGMRGRFPGANDLDTYWKNLADGVESIVVLSQQEMRAAGIPDHISRLPGYVNASPVLEGIDLFDAQFFGFSARDAALTDPQHRLFLETAWETLEDAGYDPETFPGPIGVFGGSEMSTYLFHLYQNQESLKYIDGMQLMVTNDKDHLCTQVSYRLNLKGPSVAVQTTCSTSLVAISLACESLHNHRCDMALAGGVTVRVPQRGGYYYAAGSILSPDGHCRPFDVNAQGTIVGSGVGIVALRRLSDALNEGDNIRAVILGTGINNDGSDKVGYTAPSTRGQSAAIRAAHQISGISPESIGYVEAHGTGTILGDPIEIAALTEVFRLSSQRRGFCGIGSVKSNFGHLSCAAGVAGLIKTVLSLEHRAIPPTVHYTAPNPAIDLASSPFYVTKKLSPWSRNGTPRRAGVSSFGVGGTNAHVIVEEAPSISKARKSRPFQLISLSARSEAALNLMTDRLALHLESHPGMPLADVASTLHLGRRAFRFRRSFVAASDDTKRIIDGLRASVKVPSEAAPTDRAVVFMFPGQGSQYPGMAEGLYRSEPIVKSVIDRCARILKKDLDADLRQILFPVAQQKKNAAEALKDTKWAQPALFTIGYALSSLWQSWGVEPAVMIGHSVGEYVAAALAGVFTLEDALAVIARRGRLVSALPRGSMLAVLGSAESVARFTSDEISLAANNAPGFCVLSGPSSAIERTEQALAKESIACRRLHTSHAFHSAMMDPMLAEFQEVFSHIALRKPGRPFVATLTGKLADASVATPDYWTAQLRQPVRFGDGLRLLAEGKTAAGKNPIYLEVGPGNALTTFVNGTAKELGTKPVCASTLPIADSSRPDTEEMLETLGKLWVNGTPVSWSGFHGTEQRRRVSLPTYPFERQSYWVGAHPDAITEKVEIRDTSKWMYKAVWTTSSPLNADISSLRGRKILMFDEVASAGTAITELLRATGATVLIVRRGEAFKKDADGYELNPNEPEGYRSLAMDVCSSEGRLAGVIDCWNGAPPSATGLDEAAPTALLGPMRLAHALSSQPTVRPLPVLFVARGTTLVDSADALDPARAMGSGVARVLPQEHPGLRVAHIDVDADASVARMIAEELAAAVPEPAVAMRAGRRYLETFVPIATSGSSSAPIGLPEKPVVLITGGLGHMGLHLAEAMFSSFGARLALLGRSTLPRPTEWAAASEDGSVSEAQRGILTRLSAMRSTRDEVLVLKADLNSENEVRTAVDAAIAHFGNIDLVVHGAARIDAAAFASAADTGREVMEAQFSPKIRGLFHLMSAFKGREPKRWVLHSSVSAILGGLGLAAYAGVNAMLDTLAEHRGENWLSIDWDAWDNAAEAQSVSMPLAINPPEGSDAMLRLLASPVGSRVLVAVNLFDRLKAWVQHSEGPTSAAVELHPRPNLATAFIEPRTDTERSLAEIWGRQLGLNSVGIHDRFFDLGGHSLLAAQIAAEICDQFQIELPVLKLFQAPTIGELAVIVDKAQAGEMDQEPVGLPTVAAVPDATELVGDAPGKAAKASYREFYNDVTRRLEQSGVGSASFFLNYGYISLDDEKDETKFEVPERVFNRNSVRLAFELISDAELRGLRVLDVGCGRGGTVALMADTLGAKSVGVDLSPEAVAFCRRTHKHGTKFEVGDSENLPFKDKYFDAVTNVESSHTYPNLRGFFAEVSRVLKKKGKFFYTDLLPVERWLEVRALLAPLGLLIKSERDITANVLASCNDVAATRAQAFGGHDAMIDNFLAVPGSAVYEQMNSGAWQYRMVRAERR